MEFIIHFLEGGAANYPVSIDVFEHRDAFGRGIAWSGERTPVLANMRVETLGPDYPEYDLIQSLLKEIGHSEADAQYPTRTAVGAALKERWRRVATSLPGIWTFNHIVKEAVDIDWDGQKATIVTLDTIRYAGYDLVLLSLGNLPSKAPPGLVSSDRFINGWNVAKIEGIQPNCDVLIQGAGLTAIDATMRFLESGHQTGNQSIVWQSISGTLPFIRPRQIALNPKYLRLDTLEALAKRAKEEKAPLTLASLWRLFELELKSQSRICKNQFASGTDYGGFLAMYDEFRDPSKGRRLIDYGIKGAEGCCLWFSVAKLFDEYLIPVVWNALPDKEKLSFLRSWRRDFDRFWAPIPVANGKRIKQWLTDGTIQLVRTKIELKADLTTGKIVFDPSLEDPLAEKSKAELQERYKGGFDCVIDATGIQSELEKLDSALVSNLLRRGLLIPFNLEDDLKTLGAKIDWFSGAILNAEQRPHGWLCTLTGSLTAGAHRFTNSYMAVSVSA